MASFDSINYSLRPNKQIERALAFEGVRKLGHAVDYGDLVYVGFGSIWFTDFLLAHKLLGIRDMRSMEADPIGAARAKFNRPYKTVIVTPELSSVALPTYFEDGTINDRPWLVWLDYDKALSEGMIDDLRLCVECCPQNSILLVTFSATGNAYGKPSQRIVRLKELLGDALPDDLTKEDVVDRLPEVLAGGVADMLHGAAVSAARPGGFLKGFNLVYTDSATMVTVGGVLPALGAVPAVASVLKSKHWPGLVNERIEAPHLTIREAATLQAQLPNKRAITRKSVQRLGFDLTSEQVASFAKYYRYYPSFAQISI